MSSFTNFYFHCDNNIQGFDNKKSIHKIRNYIKNGDQKYLKKRVRTETEQNLVIDVFDFKVIEGGKDIQSGNNIRQNKSIRKHYRNYQTIIKDNKENVNKTLEKSMQLRVHYESFSKDSKLRTKNQQLLNRRSFGKKIPLSEHNKIIHVNQFLKTSNKTNNHFISTKINIKSDEIESNHASQQKSLIQKTTFHKHRYLNKSHENKIINNFVENQTMSKIYYQKPQSTKNNKINFKIIKDISESQNNLTVDYLKTQPDPQAKLIIIQKIGQGTFGEVFKAIFSGQIVAVKKVYQDKNYKNRQIQILKMIKNDFVLNIISVFYSEELEGREMKEYLNVVTELYETNLFKVYKQNESSLSTIEIKLYMYQLLRGLMYLHSLEICHRDIKPQNLLINKKNLRLILCDFGSAKRLVEGEQNITYICSRCYRAPQLLFRCSNYSTKIDVWSAGCVLLQLLTQQPFFFGDDNIGQLAQIIKILGTPSKNQVIMMNPKFNLDQYKSPKIVNKTWIQLFPNQDPKLIDFISKLMVYSPQQRMSAAQALSHQYFDQLRDQSVYNQLVKNNQIFPLFNFSSEQLNGNQHLIDKLIPKWYSEHIVNKCSI